MYTTAYSVEKTKEKITKFNRAQMVQAWFADNYPHQFTRDEKKHVAWGIKWLVVGFVVASVAMYFINKLFGA